MCILLYIIYRDMFSNMDCSQQSESGQIMIKKHTNSTDGHWSQELPSHHQLCRTPVWPLGPRLLGSSGAVKKKMLSKLLCFRSSQDVFFGRVSSGRGKNWNMTAHRPIVATLLSKKKRVHSNIWFQYIPPSFLKALHLSIRMLFPSEKGPLHLEPKEMHIYGLYGNPGRDAEVDEILKKWYPLVI